eukprot:CAMPEP_0202921462 /NCGR_PEP_ID=MMETSP1392-20130828/77409_1 /ASSEMBLY_ACC=CAM_ASM_000868 /TAXON_ID=225041 /ORGANISM="Chlamydomonas chlamydogama, Strain SAG 11-48b" /LENGTH=251 /DNA_ID=CAMNT_0049615033 /DNA_START=212 /DNA_END=967 /DNA_ORIENTATION=+
MLIAPILLSSSASLIACGRALAEEVAAPVAAVPSAASTAGQFKELYDPILAYRFSYPTETVSGKKLSMVLTHIPEKYSSAAPLTADARQRIVGELMDLRNFISVSMTVGPASGVLKGKKPEDWKPLEVALTVLIDRSTSRVSSGQRVALNDVEEAHYEERDGAPFWVYEHLSQGSPTPLNPSKETYRHALAVTSVRPGLDGTPYLYTLNMSCRQELWDDLLPLFRQAASSFKLEATTNQYIPPDKDPWLFF